MDKGELTDAALLWRDIADMPENQPVLAKFRAWNKPDGEQMQHVVWLFEGKMRPYPKTDEEAYADAWKPLPGQAHERRADAGLLAALRDCLAMLDEIDAYQKAPGRGDYGQECACCMGELFDDGERSRIEAARAAITAAKGQADAEG